jgi:O-antigen/teichoic acid export membrane protein
MLSLQLPNLLLVKFYSQEVGGWFFQSQRVMGLPMAILGNAILQVYFSRVARLVHEDPQAIKPLFLRATRRLLLFSLPIGVAALLAPWLFAFIFGSEWRQAGVYTRFMSAAFIIGFVSQPTSNLNTFGLNHWQLLWDAGRLLTTLAGLSLCSVWGAPAGTAILVFGILMALNNLALYVLNRIAVERFYRL